MRNANAIFVSAIAAFGALALFGFASFVSEVRGNGLLRHLPEAEGVVVLTGGAKRLEAGINLFEASYGKRLLISGVGQSTTRGDLGRVLGKTGTFFGCCIDIDREALDTRGNAEYTAQWARLNGFSRLLIVTSDYHMPRSMMLMKRRMPDVEFVAMPVHLNKSSERSFWKLAISPIVITEYTKYVIAKFGIDPPVNTFRSAFGGQGRKRS